MLIYIFLIPIIIFLLYPLVIRGWLACRDRLEHTDVIVVPTGDMYLRCDQGIELKKRDWAKKLLFSGKTGSRNAYDFKSHAKNQGIKENDIILEDKATNTIENALFTKDILIKNDYKSIILVSSPYSQRRQCMTFKKVLKDEDIKIINYPIKKYNWLIKTPGKKKYRWQYLIEEPYYIAKYWLKGDIR